MFVTGDTWSVKSDTCFDIGDTVFVIGDILFLIPVHARVRERPSAEKQGDEWVGSA